MNCVCFVPDRPRPSIVFGMENVGSPKKCLERNTTATTLALPFRCPLRVMTF